LNAFENYEGKKNDAEQTLAKRTERFSKQSEKSSHNSAQQRRGSKGDFKSGASKSNSPKSNGFKRQGFSKHKGGSGEYTLRKSETTWKKLLSDEEAYEKVQRKSGRD
jgi:hypothetical protein